MIAYNRDLDDALLSLNAYDVDDDPSVKNLPQVGDGQSSRVSAWRIANIPRVVRGLSCSALLGLALGVSSCSNAGQYHIKLHVDATVDGVQYHGEGVQNYLCHRAYKAMNDLNQCTVLGEAIPLESSDHRYLFVLMRAADGKDPTTMASRILGANGQGPFSPRDDRLPKTWDLEPDDIPMIVRFMDLKSPRTIQLVGQSFDPRIEGGKINSITATAETTEEKVSRGRIEKILPWINDPQYGIGLAGEVGVEEAQKYPFASFVHPDMIKAGD